MTTASTILDATGRPFERTGSRPRRDLAERAIRARYDAAQDHADTANHWAAADALDADSANSKAVRSKLVQRSRYEISNNGFSDGIAQTLATDIVGLGPTLRMQSGSEGFNRLVEFTWFLWSKAIHFRRKLWCMAHAKHSDGEALGVLRRNPRVKHPIALDVVLYETEQCQTPYVPYGERGYIDGIKFDEFGNPVWYDILQEHPGSAHTLNLNLTPERVPASSVLHWFKMRRPGQHRGIPDMTSTLNLGGAARRWRESTLAHAEHIAKLTVLLKTLMAPSTEEADNIAAMSTLEMLTGMMIALPNTVEPVQLDPKQPAANYGMFHKALVNEQARPCSMPYNKAACDSSSYNYASGRLDHQTYYAALDVEREDCNDLVLDPLFDAWFTQAVVRFGWLGGNPEAISGAARAHIWDWPKHRVADVEAEANANQTKLQSGQIGLHRLYTDAGLDLADEIAAMAQAFGVDESEIQKRLLDITLPAQQPAEKPDEQSPADDAVAAMFRQLDRRREALAMNGGTNGHH